MDLRIAYVMKLKQKNRFFIKTKKIKHTRKTEIIVELIHILFVYIKSISTFSQFPFPFFYFYIGFKLKIPTLSEHPEKRNNF